MKRILTTIAGLLIMVAICHADNVLIMRMASGSKQIYDIHEPMTITTSQDSLYLRAEHLSVAYSRENVMNYSFASSTSLIDAVQSPALPSLSDVKVSRNGDIITITGICEGSKVRVFSTNGIEVTPYITYTPRAVTINLTPLTPNVYIIHISGCPDAPSIKVTK